MTKLAIIIKTSGNSYPMVISVENFSKNNCLIAISKALSVDVNKLEQLSASPRSGIFGIKELTPSVIDVVTNPVSDVGYAHTLEIECAELI